MKICEVCGKEHDGTFGSGRFCSDHCRKAFAGSSKRRTGYKRPSKEGGWKCLYCGLIFRTRKELDQHKKEAHLTISDRGVNQFVKAKLLGLPKPIVSKETREKISRAERGDKNPSKRQDVRAKISESMKKAHAEGRAHNIGECRWNNKPSYPEEWFMKVLLNEFSLAEGKDYRREYPFHKYSLDFAWPEKKLCIEIDGEQHHRFQEQMVRDTEKDSLLLKEGWSEIREDWKVICANPKGFIERVKNFIQ